MSTQPKPPGPPGPVAMAGAEGGEPPVDQAGVSERKDMVDLAVKFLTNPRVQDSPMAQKRAFLEKKGLTESEIAQAVRLAEAAAPPPQPARPPALPPLPPRSPALPPSPPRSRGWSEYALVALVVGGVSYTVVHLVRHYVIPWLNAPSIQAQRTEALQASVQQLQTSVSDTVASINESTSAIRTLLTEQQQQLQLLATQVTALHTNIPKSSEQSFKEIRDEVFSLKGLMLNKHQFPTPSRGGSTPGIPSWQRALSSPHPPHHQASPPLSPPRQPSPPPHHLNGAVGSGEEEGPASNGSSPPPPAISVKADGGGSDTPPQALDLN